MKRGIKIFGKKIIKKLIRGTVVELYSESILPKISKLSEDSREFQYTLNQLKSASNLFNNPLAEGISKISKLYPPFLISESRIGDFSYIAENSKISLTTIGKFCSIGPNFLCGWGIHPINGITTSPMFYSTLKQNGTTLSESDKFVERKKIEIGNDVYIGMNVTILDGVKIGDGAVIGAGAVVSKDIPPYAVAAGSPIKIIRYRFNDNQIEKLLQIKWWDFDKSELQDIEKDFFNIDHFLEKHART